MKRILAAAIMLVALMGLKAEGETIKGSDGRITCIGRAEIKDGNLSFDWTGVYMRVRFQGSSLAFKVSDTKKDYYNIWLDSSMDKKPDKVIAVHGKDTTIVIFSAGELKARFGKDRKAAKAPHQVILQKRTEGEQGTTTVKEFITDGVFLQADAPKPRVMEFIGDSYTCGYGTEASNKERFSPETENQNLTYACETARFFDAEHIVIAHSGIGVTRNYNGNLPDINMPNLYLQTFDKDKEVKWNARECSVKPDVTVIYLGTNDFSVRLQPAERVFVKEYVRLLREIKDNYGEKHPVICMAPKHDILMESYIRKAIDTSGLENIHFIGLSKSVHNEVSDMGADGHPNYEGHTKIAYTLIPCVATVTGWEMTSKDIK